MDVFAAIEKRASVRAFAPGAVPHEHLMEILDAGRRAPSAYNYQSYEFIAVNDRALLKELAQVQDCLAEAAVAFVVVAQKCKFCGEDAAAAVENMLLAATALGYGSLWIESYLLTSEPRVQAILGVPEERRIAAIVAIGRAIGPARQADKKPLAQIVHWNRFGQRTME